MTDIGNAQWLDLHSVIAIEPYTSVLRLDMSVNPQTSDYGCCAGVRAYLAGGASLLVKTEMFRDADRDKGENRAKQIAAQLANEFANYVHRATYRKL